MAKRIKGYKGYIIKATTKRDLGGWTSYPYIVINPKWDDVEPVWTADSVEECELWIDSEVLTDLHERGII